MDKFETLHLGDLWKVTFRDIHCVYDKEDIFEIKLHNLAGYKEGGKRIHYMTISYIGEKVEIIISRSKNDAKPRKVTCTIDENISILKKYLPLEVLLFIAHQRYE